MNETNGNGMGGTPTNEMEIQLRAHSEVDNHSDQLL